MFDHEENLSGIDRKLGNVISLLLPARSYKLSCSWTQEAPLPAIEEFSCRLLLILEELLPGELQEYFGLTQRECEVLIENLINNKLAAYTNDGLLAPSPMLQSKTKGNPDILPSLTKYEEKEEFPIFDLLTLTVISRRSYDKSKYGLPEIPTTEVEKKLSSIDIIEAFGRQYRAYLDHTRKSEIDIKKTRLYKVGNCEQDRTLQIPIDLDIHIETTATGQVNIIKDSSEKLGDLRRRPLTNKLESKISDYLNSLEIPNGGLSLEEYCNLVDDTVLLRYVSNSTFDFNLWLIDRANRKTGYGTQQTQAILGPIYLERNKLLLERFIRDLSKNWDPSKCHVALWLSSFVPLWGENGSLLGEFSRKIESLLSERETNKGYLIGVFPYSEYKDLQELKRRFGSRIPTGIGFKGEHLQDRMEILIIPEQLAVTQFHVQPSKDSSITVPIGFITTDPERIKRIHSILTHRLQQRPKPVLAWSNQNLVINELIGLEQFGVNITESHPPQKNVNTVISYKRASKKF